MSDIERAKVDDRRSESAERSLFPESWGPAPTMWDSQERPAWIAGNVRADEALRRAGGIGMRGRLALEAVERRRRPHPDSEDDGAD